MMPFWFPLSLLLALLSLDVTAIGQFMVSRPIVVGPLVGLVAGHPELGLTLGALIELLWIADVAVGSHLPMDLCMLSGISVAFASELVGRGADLEAAGTYALGIAIPLALLSTEAELVLRKFHVRWVHFAQRMAMGNHFKTFEGVNIVVLLELFLKGFLIAALGLTVAHGTSNLFFLLPPTAVKGLHDAALWLLPALGGAAVIDLVLEKRMALTLFLSLALILGLALLGHVQSLGLVGLALLAGFGAILLMAGKGETS
jgi:mannose/fructose/N-acetylgalactosamine-specific phosphotransferase system component IIC